MIKVAIELKHVQTFIFEVPRLKAMLGANALIGHVMRHELPQLLGDSGLQLGWPQTVTGNRSDFEEDPLNNVAEPLDRDNPAALYSRGILARDGGHFILALRDRPAAEAFLYRAEALLAEMLAGVAYEVRIGESKPAGETEEHQLLDLPVLQVCQETGQGPASREGEKVDWQARSVTHRFSWGTRFRQQAREKETRDLIGLMHATLYPEASGSHPETIEDLVAGGYLALIHADGNGIGKRYKKWKQKAPEDDDIHQEAHGEAFFHGMRVAVRCALATAIRQTFGPDDQSDQGVRPYEILMLGGDDLLLACRADLALAFTQHYAGALQDHPLADGAPLDVAIGVAIAGENYPLHRLHELAESLASSAKRLYRACGEAGRSVIDWQVVTQSWFADVAAARRSSEHIAYRVDDEAENLLLTGRPYFMDSREGLEGLINSEKTLAGGERAPDAQAAPRSPLRRLRGACKAGRLAGETAFQRLDSSFQAALGWSDGELWRKPCKSGDEAFYVTRALDIIDIWEIARLGHRGNDRA